VIYSILSNNFNLSSKRVTDAVDELVKAIVEERASGKIAVAAACPFSASAFESRLRSLQC
jgi:hypothetical protein